MRKILSSRALIIVCATVGVVSLIAAYSCNVLLPIEKEVQTLLDSRDLQLGSPLAVWIRHFGEPRTVDQKDFATTFFYWPDSGVAVFCHPLFKGQERSRPSEEWIITDILLPRQKVLTPFLPPVKDELTIQFSELLPLQDSADFDAMNCRTEVTTYIDQGVVQAVRIRKRDSIFGDYN